MPLIPTTALVASAGNPLTVTVEAWQASPHKVSLAFAAGSADTFSGLASLRVELHAWPFAAEATALAQVEIISPTAGTREFLFTGPQMNQPVSNATTGTKYWMVAYGLINEDSDGGTPVTPIVYATAFVQLRADHAASTNTAPPPPVSDYLTAAQITATYATIANLTTATGRITALEAAPPAHTQAESTITFTDITTGDATTVKHGYLPKLSGSTTQYLRGDGTWFTVATSTAVGDITGLGTGVATALAVNTGSAGSFIVNGGALGTPSSGSLTNCTSIPAAQLTGDVAVARIATALTAPGPIGNSTPATIIATTMGAPEGSFTIIRSFVGGNAQVNFTTNGYYAARFAGMDFRLNSSSRIEWSNNATDGLAGTNDLAIERTSAGLMQINNGTPNTYADLKLRTLCPDSTNVGPGTTGAATINKSAGSVNFAAGATSLVVTCSLCTANSEVIAVVSTNDSTAWVKSVVPAAGSFAIYLGAAATAETKVSFILFN